jgi:CoA:oxalate CoA-transferase
VEHAQLRARNMIITAGGLRMVGNLMMLSAFTDPPRSRPAPDFDADGERIRQELLMRGG